jgi:prolyl oligopeptidase
MPPIRGAFALAFLLAFEPSFAAAPATPTPAAKPAVAQPAAKPKAQPVAATQAAAGPNTSAKPPATRVEVVRDDYHGVTVEDPYRWLEDKNSPETRAWIGTQQAYTKSVLGSLPGRSALSARIAQYLRVDAVTAPKEGGGRYFYTKRIAKKDLPSLMMRTGIAGKEQVLVDPDTLSKDHTVTVDLQDVSADGKYLAYGIRRGGEDEVEIVVLDVDGHVLLPDRLSRARYFGVSIQPDRSGFFYTRYTNTEGSRIYRHTFGSDPSKDELIFGEGYGPDKISAGTLSEDGRWFVIVVYYGSAAKKVEVHLKDVANNGPVTTVVDDLEATFYPQFGGNVLYLQTNWQAPNGRILAADLQHPQRDGWREMVPEGKDPIDGFAAVGGKLVVSYLHNVASKLKVFDAEGKYERDVAFATLGSVSDLDGHWSKPEGFFVFQSFHVPKTIARLDPTTGRRDTWWRSSAPIQSDRYQLDQVWYTSKDGTQIPMFVLHRKDMALDGSHPTFLTGYGGFRASENPTFRTTLAMWVEMGGIVANPNLRGGGEFGEAWHEAGMLEKKQNVFDDFEAAAEWLIRNHYTSADKLAIEGGSNGGLLVGAFMTQRPELCRAVLCQVPLLDMLRYQNFLVARFWVPEYGSAENPEQFQFIRAYSPYQNVKAGTRYPGVLFVTGDSDTRVDPLHARKMTALMQTVATPDRPALLLYDTKIGHSGGKPIPAQIQDLTDELSFLAWQLRFTPTLEASAAGAAAVSQH